MAKNINEVLQPYSDENGYDILELISKLGYSLSESTHTDNMDVFSFNNGNGNRALLIVSKVISPTFYEESREGKRVSVIVFGKHLQVNEYITLPNKDLGAVEYGIDLMNPDTMEFFSEAKRRYRFVETHDKSEGPILPDEVKSLISSDPLHVISEIKLWSSEIRRNLAPKHDLSGIKSK